MKKNNPKKIHFLGIGGSGASAAAILAKKSGYSVTGCNLNLNTPYIKKVKDYKIKLFEGHDKDHVKDVDLLATTPALFFSDKEIGELEYARKDKKVVSWQRFVGDYLHKDKKVISVAGTHGKSTITAMAGLMMEQAGLDPTVLIGAKVPEWEANFRWGESEYFLIESDEFFNNFHNYNPDYLILNNIEFDHPDFFKNEDDLLESFSKFVKQMKGEKVLIANQDSRLVRNLLEEINKADLKQMKVIGYTLKKRSLFKFDSIYKVNDIKLSKDGSIFKVKLPDDTKIEVSLNLPGEFNITNALGAVALIDQISDNLKDSLTALRRFNGVGRRLELIHDEEDIKIYDDYAHHPTAIKLTLSALRTKYPKDNIITVVEPHSFSRTKRLLKEYKGIFKPVDHVIVGPVFKARDDHDFGINGRSIVEISGHKDIVYFDNLEKIIDHIKDIVDKKNIIIVMGAGDSYKWARNIAEFI